MGSSILKSKYNLLCVAHPDDETIFFGGLLLNRANRATCPIHGPTFANLPWMVICVTSDGNLDRKRQFTEACQLLEVKESQWWGFQDQYDKRLPIDQIVQRLQELPEPEVVFTHGIIGEYGHPHHQDVSYAVHKTFSGIKQIYSVAYNVFPEIEIRLSEKEFEIKTKILSQIYGSETNRFLNVLPSTFVEGFCRLNAEEVEAVYEYLAKGKPLVRERLKAHFWLSDYLPHLKGLPRPF